MSGLPSLAPEFVSDFMEPIRAFYNVAIGFNQSVEDFVKDNLPANTQKVVLTAYRALPETAVCASVMTGVAVLPATLFWMTRLVYILSPLMTEFFTGEASIRTLSEATGVSLANLTKSYEKLLPAIAVCSAIAAVACFVLGCTTGAYSYTVKSCFYGTLSQHLFAHLAKADQAAAAPAVGASASTAPAAVGAGVEGAALG